MNRFIVASILPNQSWVELDEKESYHARVVLKIKAGEVVEVLDGKGQKARGTVENPNAPQIRVSLTEAREFRSAQGKITLAVCVVRPERMEWLVEKACELGVGHIQPLTSDRSIVKLDSARWKKKVEKWENIVRASTKQCGRSLIPTVGVVKGLKDYLQELPANAEILMPTLESQGQSLQSIEACAKKKNWVVLIGPEGDFSPEEVRLAQQKGAQIVSLGQDVLRTETAALYILSAMKYLNICVD